MAISPISSFSMDGLVTFAESLGEALGRGVVRGMNVGLTGAISARPGPVGPAPAILSANIARRRPGRPPKAQASSGGPVPEDRRCQVEGCTNPSRSKGLCSKHYQAERRRQQGKA